MSVFGKHKNGIWVSEPSRDYLQSEKLQEAFCIDCPWAEYHEGYFNPFTGVGDPPYSTCPAEFDLGSPSCKQRPRFLDIAKWLSQLDDEVGLERTVEVE